MSEHNSIYNRIFGLEKKIERLEKILDCVMEELGWTETPQEFKAEDLVTLPFELRAEPKPEKEEKK